MEAFRVTHYIPRPPEDAWVPLPFITRLAGQADGPFYHGFATSGPLSLEDIRRREEKRTIRRLRMPCEIKQDQGLWLSPDSDVWLATEANPVKDENRVRLSRGNETVLLKRQTLPPQPFPRLVSASQGLVELLSNSMIAQKIISRKEGISILRGDYLNSLKAPGTVYYPHWEESIARAIQNLMIRIHDRGDIRPVFKVAQEHNYTYLEASIRECNIALPFEMFFETTPRKYAIDIIQLGNAPLLSLVYVKNDQAQNTLRLKHGSLYGDSFNEWIEAVRGTETLICVPNSTAADYLLFKAVQDGQLKEEFKYSQNTLLHLVAWLNSNRERGVIACDIGIAYRLITIAKTDGVDLEMSFVPYDQAVPVGLAYNNQDQSWGEVLKEVVREVLQSEDERIAESVAETKSRFNDLHLKYVYPEPAKAA